MSILLLLLFQFLNFFLFLFYVFLDPQPDPPVLSSVVHANVQYPAEVFMETVLFLKSGFPVGSSL